MPAPRFLTVCVLFSVLTLASVVLPSFVATKREQSNVQSLPNLSLGLGAALDWLAHNQSSTGSYGAYQEHLTAAAAYALWLNNSKSANAALSYSWLASQLNSSSAWFWGAEADIPGAVLYSVASSSNLNLINRTFVTSRLLQLQQSKSGFEGYYDLKLGQTVASSVDTNMALLGLIKAKEIPVQNQTYAVNYLLSLQNPDGSFNLTSTVPFDPIYSLGPDPVSITALTVLTLKSAGFAHDSPSVSSALKFLNAAASSSFHGHVYSAAISALALKSYDQPSLVTGILFILSHQNGDGGFSDTSRSSYPQSNALDTGWAATALEMRFSEQNVIAIISQVNSPPVAGFVFNPTTPLVGTTVHFDGSMSVDPDGDQLSYLWTFGDGSSAVGVKPSHSYAKAGNFTVTLTAADSGTNPSTLSDTKWLTVAVQPATVQNAPTLPLTTAELGIVIGVVVLAIIAGVSVYLIRRSTKRSRTAQP